MTVPFSHFHQRVSRQASKMRAVVFISGLQAAKALSIEHRRRADWRHRELSAESFAAEYDADDSPLPHPTHDQMEKLREV